MNPIARAALVLAFMILITVQTATGFVYTLLEVRPRAMVAIDGLIGTVFVGPLGFTGAVAVLAALSVLLPVLAYRQGLREAQAVPRPTRMRSR
jgi:hypothetical protein